VDFLDDLYTAEEIGRGGGVADIALYEASAAYFPFEIDYVLHMSLSKNNKFETGY
jgi:hypothetical protein